MVLKAIPTCSSRLTPLDDTTMMSNQTLPRFHHPNVNDSTLLPLYSIQQVKQPPRPGTMRESAVGNALTISARVRGPATRSWSVAMANAVRTTARVILAIADNNRSPNRSYNCSNNSWREFAAQVAPNSLEQHETS